MLIDIARHLMPETRLGDFQEPEELSAALREEDKTEEFSPLFNRRFLDAARQVQDFFDRQGIPVMFQIGDEPRERNINQWNRNLADSNRYADLVHSALPGARLYIDPMRDEEDGAPLLSLARHYDFIATHPWDASTKFYEATAAGRPALGYYNAICGDRYDYGFELAASHSRGFSQWHFQWQLQPFQPFQAENRSGMTLPGPDGPLDTPQYEIMSAGIDDFRYVATLRSRIAEATQAGRSGPALAQAESVLRELLSNTEPYVKGTACTGRDAIAGRSLDEWRLRLAASIQALGN
jgi:hypothetical protein